MLYHYSQISMQPPKSRTRQHDSMTALTQALTILLSPPPSPSSPPPLPASKRRNTLKLEVNPMAQPTASSRSNPGSGYVHPLHIQLGEFEIVFLIIISNREIIIILFPTRREYYYFQSCFNNNIFQQGEFGKKWEFSQNQRTGSGEVVV